MMWRCHRVRSRLARAVAEGRDQPPTGATAHHLSACRRCREEWAALRQTVREVSALAEPAIGQGRLPYAACRPVSLRPVLAGVGAFAVVAVLVAVLAPQRPAPLPHVVVGAAPPPTPSASTAAVSRRALDPQVPAPTDPARRSGARRSDDARQDRPKPPTRRRVPHRRTWLAQTGPATPGLASARLTAAATSDDADLTGGAVVASVLAPNVSVAAAAYAEQAGDLGSAIDQIARALAHEETDERPSAEKGPTE
ncbi:MAG TPA: hypothetical protein VLH79_08070 [Chthonomonadales bacterium]|nr:hypothetical protein [Chthonomonadales bacterium]